MFVKRLSTLVINVIYYEAFYVLISIKILKETNKTIVY